MDELLPWLRAVLDEEERLALDAGGSGPAGRWVEGEPLGAAVGTESGETVVLDNNPPTLGQVRDRTAAATTSIVEFLNARLDEDEQVALAACNKGHRSWRADFGENGDYEVNDDAGRTVTPELVEWTQQAIHVAHHDPLRALAEVVAKRRVVARHHADSEWRSFAPDACVGCGGEGELGDPRVETLTECPELRDLAAIWSTHQDYDTTWGAQ